MNHLMQQIADRTRHILISELGGPVVVTPEQLAMKILSVHACKEWDGLVIDQDDPEWEACICALKLELTSE